MSYGHLMKVAALAESRILISRPKSCFRLLLIKKGIQNIVSKAELKVLWTSEEDYRASGRDCHNGRATIESGPKVVLGIKKG